jgi:hypothetical protein
MVWWQAYNEAVIMANEMWMIDSQWVPLVEQSPQQPQKYVRGPNRLAKWWSVLRLRLENVTKHPIFEEFKDKADH